MMHMSRNWNAEVNFSALYFFSKGQDKSQCVQTKSFLSGGQVRPEIHLCPRVLVGQDFPTLV